MPQRAMTIASEVAAGCGTRRVVKGRDAPGKPSPNELPTACRADMLRAFSAEPDLMPDVPSQRQKSAISATKALNLAERNANENA